MTEVIERTSIRAILLTPSHEVLLMRIRPPDGRAPFWITPGGGIEAGESRAECLRRELREEVGLDASGQERGEEPEDRRAPGQGCRAPP